MYKITNRSNQRISLMSYKKGEPDKHLFPKGSLVVQNLTPQINNLKDRGLLRIDKLSSGKESTQKEGKGK